MSSTEPSGAFGFYWKNYGGLRALLKSGYLWSALLFNLLCYHFWLNPGWWDDVIMIIPSLIGFSLAAFAVLLAFTSDKFLNLVTHPIPGSDPAKPGPSVYASTGAAFVHFILLQFVALFAAIFCKGFHVPQWVATKLGIAPYALTGASHVVWFFSYWVFIYSMLSGVTATMRIFMLAYWFDKVAHAESKAQEQNPPDQGGQVTRA